jgi:hypothetical protein
VIAVPMTTGGRVAVAGAAVAALGGITFGLATGVLRVSDDRARWAHPRSGAQASPGSVTPGAGSTTAGPAPRTGGAVCPNGTQVLTAAAEEEGGTTPILLGGPHCAAGWAAALVGLPDGRTRRIVFRGGTVVVHQPTLDECPRSIARMPAALRTAVAC